jgi:DNA-binding Lrp family transcriptional regulator
MMAGGTAMVQAFVLIQAGVGMASRVGQAVGAIQGVRSADIVTGPYDVVVRVEAASIDALGRLAVSKIQAVEGITRTLTCPVVRL